MKRRDFIRWAGAAGLAGAAGPVILSGQERPYFLREGDIPRFASLSAADGDYPFPYDPEFFEAAERIVFLGPDVASLNIIPKDGKSLDIKIHRAPGQVRSADAGPLVFCGVKDSLEVRMSDTFWGPELYYRIEYRDGSSSGSWRSTPSRRVKTPNARLRDGRVQVLFIGDDHTFDDADQGNRIVTNEAWKALRLNGNYVNEMVKWLKVEPDYKPNPGGQTAGKTMSGFCLASTINQILNVERPDFIVLLGDTNGIGAGYKWSGLGLQDPSLGLPAEVYDEYARLFWLRMRRMYSALTPHIPVYLALGNHDGEASSDSARIPAMKYRKKYWRMPGAEGGNSPDENYFSLAWNQDYPGRGGMQFIVLDCVGYANLSPRKPGDWTLGAEQKSWFKSSLSYEASWKFVFYHHVLGGWPFGSNENALDYAYGRGPLFTAEDYAPFVDNPESVEQVELTRLMQQAGVQVNFYGHDHVFHSKMIGLNARNKNLYGICVGSTKHIGEIQWYEGPIWQKESGYGSYGTYYDTHQTTGRPADFWGPAGYARLTIDSNGASVDYLRSADNHPYTNIPPTANPGNILSTVIL